MKISAFFDPHTSAIGYVVADERTGACAIIDPVLDYDPVRGRITTAWADQVIAHVQGEGWKTEWILETHAHADHLSSADYLKDRLGGKTGIGRGIIPVIAHWLPRLGTAADTPADGSQFDRLFDGGDTFDIGSLEVTVLDTPGHTAACVSFKVGNALFVGDTLFMPDYGTARTDFPGGDAHALYRSIHSLYALPDSTRVFTGHDYPPDTRGPAWESTIGEQRESNVMINSQVTEEEYVAVRRGRDKGNAPPRLLLPALQVNLRAGKLGAPRENGLRYLQIPINGI